MEKVTVKQVLEYLEAAGWSDLIDKRWERKVIKDIVLTFPSITLETLDEVLDVVLV
jgi:uncharacterized protein (DUF433 family)